MPRNTHASKADIETTVVHTRGRKATSAVAGSKMIVRATPVQIFTGATSIAKRSGPKRMRMTCNRPNAQAHRPPPTAGAASEPSVRETRCLETATRGGGSVERMVRQSRCSCPQRSNRIARIKTHPLIRGIRTTVRFARKPGGISEPFQTQGARGLTTDDTDGHGWGGE